MRFSFLDGRRQLLCVALLVTGLARTAGAQDAYNLFFSASSASLPTGGTLAASVRAQNQPDAITGFSLGVAHDASVLTLQDVALGEGVTTALGGADPDDRFLAINTEPPGGSGFTVAMVLSFDNAAVVIPAGDDTELVTATYSVVGEEGATGTVSFSDSLGSPGVENVLDVQGGVAKPVTPSGANASIAVEVISAGGAPFIRGDVSQSGRLDVIDATVILRYQFSAGDQETPASMNCLISYNADGSTGRDVPDQEDELDLELTDGIYVLNALFVQGPVPPAPFPACAPSPTLASERMRCNMFDRCP